MLKGEENILGKIVKKLTKMFHVEQLAASQKSGSLSKEWQASRKDSSFPQRYINAETSLFQAERRFLFSLTIKMGNVII